MKNRTCFVIMPIGDQTFADETISATDLKSRYTDLIREAILKAEPTLEVTRADEVAIPGTITEDILTRIMHSDVVVADVTYPNPNVFYELGLRHASRAGTIILRDVAGPHPPFDIAHLRHIAYENTPSGLKKLSSDISQYLSHFRSNPQMPDNQFLSMAKLTHFQYPEFGIPEEEDPETAMMTALLSQPEILNLFVRKSQGENVDDSELAIAMMSNPDLAGMMAKHLIQSGHSFLPDPTAQATKPIPKPRRKKPTKKKASARSRKRK